MHELSVTQSILDIALNHAKDAAASRIISLNITIGEFTSIVDDSVQFYWDILTKETIAENSELIFNRVKSEILCKDCHHKYSPNPGELACPKCGSINVEILAGKEFFLDSIDIEK